MVNLLLWIGALLMLFGFLSTAFGFFFLVPGTLAFMFGATWNMIIMLLEGHGIL